MKRRALVLLAALALVVNLVAVTAGVRLSADATVLKRSYYCLDGYHYGWTPDHSFRSYLQAVWRCHEFGSSFGWWI